LLSLRAAGLNQEIFEFVLYVRRRGQALLASLVDLLVSPGIPDEPDEIMKS
jgi:hypothetical protein